MKHKNSSDHPVEMYLSILTNLFGYAAEVYDSILNILDASNSNLQQKLTAFNPKKPIKSLSDLSIHLLIELPILIDELKQTLNYSSIDLKKIIQMIHKYQRQMDFLLNQFDEPEHLPAILIIAQLIGINENQFSTSSCDNQKSKKEVGTSSSRKKQISKEKVNLSSNVLSSDEKQISNEQQQSENREKFISTKTTIRTKLSYLLFPNQLVSTEIRNHQLAQDMTDSYYSTMVYPSKQRLKKLILIKMLEFKYQNLSPNTEIKQIVDFLKIIRICNAILDKTEVHRHLNQKFITKFLQITIHVDSAAEFIESASKLTKIDTLRKYKEAWEQLSSTLTDSKNNDVKAIILKINQILAENSSSIRQDLSEEISKLLTIIASNITEPVIFSLKLLIKTYKGDLLKVRSNEFFPSRSIEIIQSLEEPYLRFSYGLGEVLDEAIYSLQQQEAKMAVFALPTLGQEAILMSRKYRLNQNLHKNLLIYLIRFSPLSLTVSSSYGEDSSGVEIAEIHGDDRDKNYNSSSTSASECSSSAEPAKSNTDIRKKANASSSLSHLATFYALINLANRAIEYAQKLHFGFGSDKSLDFLNTLEKINIRFSLSYIGENKKFLDADRIRLSITELREAIFTYIKTFKASELPTDFLHLKHNSDKKYGSFGLMLDASMTMLPKSTYEKACDELHEKIKKLVAVTPSASVKHSTIASGFTVFPLLLGRRKPKNKTANLSELPSSQDPKHDHPNNDL